MDLYLLPVIFAQARRPFQAWKDAGWEEMFGDYLRANSTEQIRTGA
jgi:hypothetical protein